MKKLNFQNNEIAVFDILYYINHFLYDIIISVFRSFKGGVF